MPARWIASIVCGVSLVLFFALAPIAYPNPNFRFALGDLVPLAVATATVVLTTRNAFDSRGHTRLFWALMTAGMVMRKNRKVTYGAWPR